VNLIRVREHQLGLIVSQVLQRRDAKLIQSGAKFLKEKIVTLLKLKKNFKLKDRNIDNSKFLEKCRQTGD